MFELLKKFACWNATPKKACPVRTNFWINLYNIGDVHHSVLTEAWNKQKMVYDLSILVSEPRGTISRHPRRHLERESSTTIALGWFAIYALPTLWYDNWNNHITFCKFSYILPYTFHNPVITKKSDKNRLKHIISCHAFNVWISSRNQRTHKAANKLQQS